MTEPSAWQPWAEITASLGSRGRTLTHHLAGASPRPLKRETSETWGDFVVSRCHFECPSLYSSPSPRQKKPVVTMMSP